MASALRRKFYVRKYPRRTHYMWKAVNLRIATSTTPGPKVEREHLKKTNLDVGHELERARPPPTSGPPDRPTHRPNHHHGPTRGAKAQEHQRARQPEPAKPNPPANPTRAAHPSPRHPPRKHPPGPKGDPTENHAYKFSSSVHWGSGHVQKSRNHRIRVFGFSHKQTQKLLIQIEAE